MFGKTGRRLIKLVPVALLISGAQFAQAACGAPKTLECQATSYVTIQQNLDAIYGRLLPLLSPAAQLTMEQDQHNWENSRDKACSNTVNGEAFEDLACAAARTNDRIAALNDVFKTLTPEAAPLLATMTTVSRIDAGGKGPHGCAVFGGGVGSACDNYPIWTDGTWLPPAGVLEAHILVVGGGGGGASNLFRGIGGPGGGSGKVVDEIVSLSGQAVRVVVGAGGIGGAQLEQSGTAGASSSFADIIAMGGQGGTAQGGGNAGTGDGGSSGGGGSGGGSYMAGFHPGSGGAGGFAGSAGQSGGPATDANNPVQGLAGGSGTAFFPNFAFRRIVVSAGHGGRGGISAGESGSGCGGGGGGGAGGVLLQRSGGNATSGSHEFTSFPCGTDRGKSGDGGAGYGAGGGGAGNGMTWPGGAGSAGLVYIEW